MMAFSRRDHDYPISALVEGNLACYKVQKQETFSFSLFYIENPGLPLVFRSYYYYYYIFIPSSDIDFGGQI